MELEEKLDELKLIYLPVQESINRRLEEFRRLWYSGTDEDIFYELIFCLLTPQSRARLCWQAVVSIRDKEILISADRDALLEELKSVRFMNKKADYILEAREKFLKNGRVLVKSEIKGFSNVRHKREWLVRNIRGMGYKEASHFLRNIGFGEELAILDRHILKNLKYYGVIEEIPESLSRKRYSGIEEKMKKFSDKLNIPMSHLDLLFWYNQTGEVFK